MIKSVVLITATCLLLVGCHQTPPANIVDFDTCIAAGQPIAQSAPPSCTSLDGQIYFKQLEEQSQTTTANPAAVYCTELNYQYEIKTDSNGSQYGVCIFPDGSECNAWEFYREQCP